MTGFIWMLGDVHGNFDHVLETVNASGETPAAVIFLGDLECPIPFTDCVAGIEAAGIACWAIPENHDTDSIENYENLWGVRLFRERNLHGRVVEIEGIRIAGMPAWETLAAAKKSVRVASKTTQTKISRATALLLGQGLSIISRTKHAALRCLCSRRN